MTNYIEKVLMPGETLVRVTRLHWIIFMPAITMLVLGLLAWHYANDVGLLRYLGFSIWRHYSVLQVIVVSVGLLIGYKFASALATYYGTEYAITNKRVAAKYGIIRQITSELLLSRLQAVEIAQSGIGRLLNYGTIIVIGLGGSRDIYPNVRDPLAFQRLVHDQLKSVS